MKNFNELLPTLTKEVDNFSLVRCINSLTKERFTSQVRNCGHKSLMLGETVDGFVAIDVSYFNEPGLTTFVKHVDMSGVDIIVDPCGLLRMAKFATEITYDDPEIMYTCDSDLTSFVCQIPTTHVFDNGRSETHNLYLTVDDVVNRGGRLIRLKDELWGEVSDNGLIKSARFKWTLKSRLKKEVSVSKRFRND